MIKKKLKSGTSLYWSYRFSKDSNYISFNEWLAKNGINSIYMSEIRNNACKRLSRQIRDIDYLLEGAGAKWSLDLKETHKALTKQLERIIRRYTDLSKEIK